MKLVLSGIIVMLACFLAAMGAGYFAYRKIRRKVRGFSQMAFGTADVMQGLRQIERESQVTPKSVSAATSICLPNIMRDFPDFHYDEMKRRAENVLTSFLRSIDEQDAALLTEGTDELRDKLQMKLDMLRESGTEEHYENIRIHRTEICAYQRDQGRCSVIFQSAVEYRHRTGKGGQVQGEGGSVLCQSRYNVELIYIQDRDLVENTADSGMAMNCPNCGAPLPGLGAKKCAYCDSPIVEFNIRTWNFSDVQEVR